MTESQMSVENIGMTRGQVTVRGGAINSKGHLTLGRGMGGDISSRGDLLSGRGNVSFRGHRAPGRDMGGDLSSRGNPAPGRGVGGDVNFRGHYGPVRGAVSSRGHNASGTSVVGGISSRGHPALGRSDVGFRGHSVSGKGVGGDVNFRGRHDTGRGVGGDASSRGRPASRRGVANVRGHHAPGRGVGGAVSSRGHSASRRGVVGDISFRGHPVPGRRDVNFRGHYASGRGMGDDVNFRGYHDYGGGVGGAVRSRGHPASRRSVVNFRGHHAPGRGVGGAVSFRGHSASGRGMGADVNFRVHHEAGRGVGADVSSRGQHAPVGGAVSSRGQHAPVGGAVSSRGHFAPGTTVGGSVSSRGHPAYRRGVVSSRGRSAPRTSVGSAVSSKGNFAPGTTVGGDINSSVHLSPGIVVGGDVSSRDYSALVTGDVIFRRNLVPGRGVRDAVNCREHLVSGRSTQIFRGSNQFVPQRGTLDMSRGQVGTGERHQGSRGHSGMLKGQVGPRGHSGLGSRGLNGLSRGHVGPQGHVIMPDDQVGSGMGGVTSIVGQVGTMSTVLQGGTMSAEGKGGRMSTVGQGSMSAERQGDIEILGEKVTNEESIEMSTEELVYGGDKEIREEPMAMGCSGINEESNVHSSNGDNLQGWRINTVHLNDTIEVSDDESDDNIDLSHDQFSETNQTCPTTVLENMSDKTFSIINASPAITVGVDIVHDSNANVMKSNLVTINQSEVDLDSVEFIVEVDQNFNTKVMNSSIQQPESLLRKEENKNSSVLLKSSSKPARFESSGNKSMYVTYCPDVEETEEIVDEEVIMNDRQGMDIFVDKEEVFNEKNESQKTSLGLEKSFGFLKSENSFLDNSGEEITEYPCDQCNWILISPKQLKKHKQVMHKLKTIYNPNTDVNLITLGAQNEDLHQNLSDEVEFENNESHEDVKIENESFSPLIDTFAVAKSVRSALLRDNIPLSEFSNSVLGLSQWTVTILLNNPKPWSQLSREEQSCYETMKLWIDKRATSRTWLTPEVSQEEWASRTRTARMRRTPTPGVTNPNTVAVGWREILQQKELMMEAMASQTSHNLQASNSRLYEQRLPQMSAAKADIHSEEIPPESKDLVHSLLESLENPEVIGNYSREEGLGDYSEDVVDLVKDADKFPKFNRAFVKIVPLNLSKYGIKLDDYMTMSAYVKKTGPRETKNMKRGADHYMYKAEEDKVATKVYVPTGLPRGKRKGIAKKNINMKRGADHHMYKEEKDKITKPYVPTGLPRGRKKMAEEDKKTKPYVPTGKPRGRKRK